ncbi:phage fiber proteins family [Trichomonas vaginalis G3]|uniref:phage fiber proteins family n=1 Tax=Trichomonas vaginalis (strain ATCC PRA-98 / G3) TaxID=412133 RepID=UPI0021E52D5A|nr:phage fiber proteins family [Trichomonas vaginalis G3]KAI5537206.1 phage fiber proteins family [Trichomonas vaginalis G3]
MREFVKRSRKRDGSARSYIYEASMILEGRGKKETVNYEEVLEKFMEYMGSNITYNKDIYSEFKYYCEQHEIEVMSKGDFETLMKDSKEVVHENSVEIVHENSEEVIHECNDEIVHENSKEVIHENSDEIVHENSKEVIHENSDEIVHENSKEVVHENSEEVVHENSDEIVHDVVREEAIATKNVIKDFIELNKEEFKEGYEVKRCEEDFLAYLKKKRLKPMAQNKFQSMFEKKRLSYGGVRSTYYFVKK